MKAGDGTASSDRLPCLPRTFEAAKYALGMTRVAGVDEAGRGPLAGPVVAAACIVPADVEVPGAPIPCPVACRSMALACTSHTARLLARAGVHDSKKLTEEERERVFAILTTDKRIAYAVAVVDHKEIDEINILQASMRAMERAVEQLKPAPESVFVDGPYVPAALAETYGKHAVPLIKGDSRCFSVAAASVIAKVTRDRIMVELDREFPQYNFAQHKGYPTAAHKAAVFKHGPCRVHRRTFQPLKSWFPVEATPSPSGDGGEAAEPAGVTKPGGNKAGKRAPNKGTSSPQQRAAAPLSSPAKVEVAKAAKATTRAKAATSAKRPSRKTAAPQLAAPQKAKRLRM